MPPPESGTQGFLQEIEKVAGGRTSLPLGLLDHLLGDM